MSWRLKELLTLALEAGGDSLHLHTGLPAVAMSGQGLVPLTEARLTPEDCDRIAASLLGRSVDELQQERLGGSEPELCRYRAEVFRQRDALSLVFKLAPWHHPRLEELRLPASVKECLAARSGLFLVSGPRGAGKTWSLAGALDELHRGRALRSLVLSPSPEICLEPHRGMVTHHTVKNWSRALQQAQSADIDVFVLDGVPWEEVLEDVLRLCESGALVLASVRESADSYCAFAGLWERLPAWSHYGHRSRLSEAVQAVLYQKLIPQTHSQGLTPAVEIAIATPVLRSLLEDERCIQYYNHLQTGNQLGMQTLEQSLFFLFREGLIDEESALAGTRFPEDLSRMITAWRTHSERG